MDTETKLFVSSVRWCCATLRLTIAPANAPAKITANTRTVMVKGVNIILYPESGHSPWVTSHKRAAAQSDERPFIFASRMTAAVIADIRGPDGA
jgi:hypothetical protein